MKHFALKVIFSGMVRWFLKIVVGVKFDKADFLTELDQFIIVANHNSHLDTMTLMASVPSKILNKVKPVAAKDHFGKTNISTWLSNTFINTLLIKRGRDKENIDNDPIYNMVSALDEGYSLILFPEGSRGLPEIEQKLKPGIAMILAERPSVHIVPAYMKGMGKAMPKGDSLIIPFNSRLIYGQPLQVKSDTVSDILVEIEEELSNLKDIANG